MLVTNTLFTLGGILGLALAAGPMEPGVQFFLSAPWYGSSKTIVPVEGKCTPIYPGSPGSVKMLNGGMECAFFFNSDCTASHYNPKSKFRSGNDNTPKPLSDWMDLSAMNGGDRQQGPWIPSAFICRGLFNNLLKPDSSSNNIHVTADGWHEPNEAKYKDYPKGP